MFASHDAPYLYPVTLHTSAIRRPYDPGRRAADVGVERSLEDRWKEQTNFSPIDINEDEVQLT